MPAQVGVEVAEEAVADSLVTTQASYVNLLVQVVEMVP
jgi:hypothetical protein